jgi:hypothetical protein
LNRDGLKVSRRFLNTRRTSVLAISAVTMVDVIVKEEIELISFSFGFTVFLLQNVICKMNLHEAKHFGLFRVCITLNISFALTPCQEAFAGTAKINGVDRVLGLRKVECVAWCLTSPERTSVPLFDEGGEIACGCREMPVLLSCSSRRLDLLGPHFETGIDSETDAPSGPSRR